MKLLITGGSGMVGKNLIEFLNLKSNFSILSPSSSDLNLLNLNSLEKYISKNQPDAIIHCAGLVGGIQANIKNPYHFLYVNLQMGINLIHAATNNKIEKFINLGSSCMYPKNREGELKESDILTGPLEPTNEGYALAKITTSKLCEFSSAQYGLNYKTLIPCNLYGMHDKFDPSNSHMIPAVIRKIHEAKKNNSSVTIWGNGEARREFMYAEDLSDFILLALNNYDELDVYTNVGLGQDYSILEYYQAISKVVGYEGEFLFDITRPVGMNRKLCSVQKQNILGWSPKHSLEDGLKKTNDFFIKYYGI